MTIGFQQLRASLGRAGLAGRLLVDHLRREFDVIICDGVFDSPPEAISRAHPLPVTFSRAAWLSLGVHDLGVVVLSGRQAVAGSSR